MAFFEFDPSTQQLLPLSQETIEAATTTTTTTATNSSETNTNTTNTAEGSASPAAKSPLKATFKSLSGIKSPLKVRIERKIDRLT